GGLRSAPGRAQPDLGRDRRQGPRRARPRPAARHLLQHDPRHRPPALPLARRVGGPRRREPAPRRAPPRPERAAPAAQLPGLLPWAYYSAQILLVGAEFTEVYSRRYGSRREQ